MTDRAAAEEALRQWRQVVERRDELIQVAHQAGVPIRRIHLLTGVGRSTIYRILRLEPNMLTGGGR